MKLKIKKDDMVMVIAGSEKGNKGKVLKAIPSEGKVIVEKLHRFKRHMKPSKSDPKGGIVERERAVDISNVMIVCSNCDAATRVQYKTLEDGTKVRVCRKCNEVLDKV